MMEVQIRICGGFVMRKIYTVLIIVLPIFVGSLAIGDLIHMLSGYESSMNLFVDMAMAVVGMATGITNILKLLR